MREIDEFGLSLCRFQAELFSESIEKTACSSEIFIRRFMFSGYAQRIDSGAVMFEATDVDSALNEIEAQFGKTNYGKVKYSSEEMYWIGYIYRYWCYIKQKSSNQVYRIVKPKELRGLFLPYHSLDPSKAIERIMEAKGICDPTEEYYIERGVALLREKVFPYSSRKEKIQ